MIFEVLEGFWGLKNQQKFIKIGSERPREAMRDKKAGPERPREGKRAKNEPT